MLIHLFLEIWWKGGWLASTQLREGYHDVSKVRLGFDVYPSVFRNLMEGEVISIPPIKGKLKPDF